MPKRCSRRPNRSAEALGAAAVGVLLTADARAKAAAATAVAQAWRAGTLAADCSAAVPDRPARPPRPVLLDPSRMPKRGKAGTLASRQALLHAVAHIELNAIDLAFDMVARFGAQMPRDFCDDWVRIGGEEALHFTLLADRLEVLGSHYGALPAHDGLWQSALATAHDRLARLAVVPLVLEARGLDVTPAMIARLERAGDDASAMILRLIYADEIGHVEAGSKWFHFCCAESQLFPEAAFKLAVATHFRGHVKPPFNDSAREQAGLPSGFYQPVVPLPS